jgi:hypothetical protein
VELILIGSSALAAVDDSTFVKREDYPAQVVNNLKNLMRQYNNLLLLTEFWPKLFLFLIKPPMGD